MPVARRDAPRLPVNKRLQSFVVGVHTPETEPPFSAGLPTFCFLRETLERTAEKVSSASMTPLSFHPDRRAALVENPVGPGTVTPLVEEGFRGNAGDMGFVVERDNPVLAIRFEDRLGRSAIRISSLLLI
jgi:hypothetical protein